MAKIPMKHQYRLAVMRYTNNSDLLPPTMDVCCGGLSAHIEADRNYLLPVFIIRALGERYALQHKEIRGNGVKAGVMRQFETKRVRVNVEYELVPENVVGYQAVSEFLTKLEDPTSDEFKEFISVDGDSERVDPDSLFVDPVVPITQLDFDDIKPKPPEYYESLNRASYVRNPNAIQPTNDKENEALKEVNSMLKEKISKQDDAISELKEMMKSLMESKAPKKRSASKKVAIKEPEELPDNYEIAEEIMNEDIVENMDNIDTTMLDAPEQVLTEEEKESLESDA